MLNDKTDLMGAALDAGCVDAAYMLRIYSRYLQGVPIRDIVLELARERPDASLNEDDANRIIDHMNATSQDPPFQDEPEYELHVWGGDQFDSFAKETIPMSVVPDTHAGCVESQYERRMKEVIMGELLRSSSQAEFAGDTAEARLFLRLRDDLKSGRSIPNVMRALRIKFGSSRPAVVEHYEQLEIPNPDESDRQRRNYAKGRLIHNDNGLLYLEPGQEDVEAVCVADFCKDPNNRLPQDLANADRAASCWNACRHVDNPEDAIPDLINELVACAAYFRKSGDEGMRQSVLQTLGRHSVSPP